MPQHSRAASVHRIALACLLFLGAPAGEAALTGAAGFKQAMEQSRRTGKPVAVLIYTDWCPYCQRLINKVLSSGEARQYLATILDVRINPEKGRAEQAIARQYGVTGYPTYLMFPPGSDQPRRVNAHGGMTPAQFVQACKQASGVQRPAPAPKPAGRRAPTARPEAARETAPQETARPKQSSQPAPAGFVTLHFTDGREVTGWIIHETPDALTLGVKSGIATFERTSIQRVEAAVLEE